MWLCAVCFLGGHGVSAQAILAPPFGLQWGDTPDKVLQWAETQKLDVLVKIPGKRPEIREFRVSAEHGSLPSHQAHALEARYHWGKLYEVSLHYGSSADKTAEVKVNFEKLKTAMAVKHGVFQANNKQESKDDGYIQRSVSYHVEPVSGLMLMIIFTELEDVVRKKETARFSLLYRNHNILPKE